MNVRLYMDVNVPSAITRGLRMLGIDVMTSQEDGTRRLKDPALLDRATELERVLFTQDIDFLREAYERHQTGENFSGIIYARQNPTLTGKYIEDLEIIARASKLEEWLNKVEYLPL